MDAGIISAIAVVVALVGLALLHVFGSPKEAQNGLSARLSYLEQQYAQLAAKVAGDHGALREILAELRGTVLAIDKSVTRLTIIVDGLSNGRH